jgi:hypothetical protein
LRDDEAIQLDCRGALSGRSRDDNHFEDITYCPNTHAKISGATIVASLSIMYFGVLAPSFPHVIFSFGTAPE